MLRRLPAQQHRSTIEPVNPSNLLSQRSRERAMRSMRCLPFTTALYRDLQETGLDAAGLWNDRRRYGRTPRWYRSADALEQDLRWLITVGVLRREVDGQGLTSRFRLTPLGRQLLDGCPDLLEPAVGPTERLRHALRRSWPSL